MTPNEMYSRLAALVNTSDRLQEALKLPARPLGLQPAQELWAAIGNIMMENKNLGEYAKSARNAALEEAAKIAKSCGQSGSDDVWDNACEAIAAAIREKIK